MHIPLLFSIIQLMQLPAAFGSESARTEWKLIQYHFERGASTVYITHDALKIVKSGFELLAKAPDWTIYCFRPADKTIWIGKIEQFNGIALTSPWAVPKNKILPLKVVGTRTRHGMKVIESCSSSRDRYFTADEIEVAPQAAHILCRYYYVAETDKVPLDFIVQLLDEQPKRKEFPWLDLDFKQAAKQAIRFDLTTKSVTKVTYDPATFKLPSGYTRVADLNRVAYSEKQQGQLTDLLEDLGTATKLDGKDKKR